MKKWIKIGLIAVFALLVMCAITLEILYSNALNNGIKVVGLPADGQMIQVSEGNDYSDAFRLQYGRDITISELTSAQSMIGGKIVFQDDSEIIFKGRAPGLYYYAAYQIDNSNNQTSITLSTSVFYETWIGKLYFTPVKQFHKRLVPFALYLSFRNVDLD